MRYSSTFCKIIFSCCIIVLLHHIAGYFAGNGSKDFHCKSLQQYFAILKIAFMVIVFDGLRFVAVVG